MFATKLGPAKARRTHLPGPFTAGCVLSVALHVLLVAGSRPGGMIGSAQQTPSHLQVTLPTSAARNEAVAALPTQLKPLASSRPRYAQLLPFAPTIEPPFDERAYVPASRLTTQPTPVDEIQVTYPRGVHHLRVLTVALTLYIDEHGRVESVRVEEPEFPEAYERAAIDAFANGRFHPGLDGDQPVKSRLRIRVAFDSGDSGETMLAPLPRTLS